MDDRLKNLSNMLYLSVLFITHLQNSFPTNCLKLINMGDLKCYAFPAPLSPTCSYTHRALGMSVLNAIFGAKSSFSSSLFGQSTRNPFTSDMVCLISGSK